MPVPKRRTSKSRRDKRRTHDSLTAPTRMNC
ncbi:MAG: 50S ribosomal protein L32, partial [Candidatus Cloacimonetes bacterium]|nr:50S ribosomal protein L32 [Candidatus Cloacimonadota bacterium]